MENTLKIISWNITGRCNLLCSHCYLPAYKGENNLQTDTYEELNTEEALQVIDQIASVNHEVMLILSGGEPLLRKDIFELAKHASGKGMMVLLGSNGLLINNEVATNLRRSGVSGVSISLDSVDPAIHDSIRSLDGAWESAVKAINICQRNGLAVQINTVVTQNNYDEIPELIKFSNTLGAKVFSPFFLVCTGRGEEATDITTEQYEQILLYIVESQGRYEKMMVRPRCAPVFRRILHQNNSQSPLLKMDTGRCMAGIDYCRITPDGNVTPCPYMPLSVGNVKTERFEDLWKNSSEFISLRTPSLKGKCSICKFRLICGGCRARAFASYMDYMEEDPWCVYTPEGEDAIKPLVFGIDNSGTISKPIWTKEAEERLKKIPFFVRSMVRGAVERYALENTYKEITPKIMQEARHKMTMGKAAGH